MKNKLRLTLLSNLPQENQGALKAIEVIERYSPADLEYLIMKHLYKESSLPYEYIKAKGALVITQLERRFQCLNDLPQSFQIIPWIINYCQSKTDFQEIYFDYIPFDKFLSFAAIFNENLYDDINALLSFAEETESKECWCDRYSELEVHKHIHALGNIEEVIANLRKTSYVLETYKKNRAVFTNITYMPRARTTLCPANLQSLLKRQPEWFGQSVSTRKSDKYESMKKHYPIEIKAFEEILSGERAYYIRTDEPDYTTPPLKTYDFSKTTYSYLSTLGQTIYRELKEEMGKKIPSAHEFKRPGLLKTDLEEMRKTPGYSVELEGMHKQDVICVADSTKVLNNLLDCVLLECRDVLIKPTSAWSTDEAKMDKLVVEIDTSINLDMITKIPHRAIKLYGRVEPQIKSEGTALSIQVNALQLEF